MTYEVIVSEQADLDLRGIYEYIAFELQSPDHASGQLDRLEGRIMGLSEYPYRFRAYQYEPWHRKGVRIMPVDNYLVFYVPDERNQIVTIVRVMYGGRKTEEQLNEYT